MANISQNVNIEMLEKLPDGTYKRKYPKTRADDGTTFDDHLAEDATQAHLAKNIGIEDVAGNFLATEVEGAMNELFTNVSDGKDLVGGAITDVDDSVVIPTDPTFQNLADVIGQISTGKKWASGSLTVNSSKQQITGLSFRPSYVILSRNDVSSSELYRNYVFTDVDNNSLPFYIKRWYSAGIRNLGVFGTAHGSPTLTEDILNWINDDGFTLHWNIPRNINLGWIAFE